jgi:MFS family permease
VRRPPLAGVVPKPAGRASSRAYAAYALGLLTLINLLNYADRNVVFALFEPIKRDLRLTDQQLGWIGSAYIIVLSLAALPLGVIGDLRSRRGVITFGVTLWSASTALSGLARSFWHLFAFRALVGVGEAGYAPTSQAIIAAYYRGARRAMAMGIYSAGMAIGGLLGVWVGGELYRALDSWRLTFVAMGAPGLLLALLAARLREPDQRPPRPLRGWLARAARWSRSQLLLVLRVASPLLVLAAVGALLSGVLLLFRGAPAEVDAAVFGVCVAIGAAWTVKRLVPIAVSRTQQAGAVAATAVEEFGHALAVVLRTPTLIWIFLGGALITFAVNGLIAWAPSFLQRAHGLPVDEVGRRFGWIALVGGVGGALAGGRLADSLLVRWRGGRVFMTGVGFLLGAPVCTALILVTDLGVFAPLLLATYFFYTLYNGPLAAVLFDVVPEAVRASVLGAFVLFSHLAGDAMAPPLIGYISDVVGARAGPEAGLRTAMLVLPAAGVLGGLLILVALRTVGRDMERVK